MEGSLPQKPTASEKLRADLDRSREDWAAGRVEALGPVLSDIHSRAARRIERKAESKGQSRSKLG